MSDFLQWLLGIASEPTPSPEMRKLSESQDTYPPEIRRTPFEPQMGANVTPDMIRWGGKSIKGPGWLGTITDPSLPGWTSTELSIGPVENQVPLLVPGMTQSDAQRVMRGETYQEDYDRAWKFAEERRKKGLDPFRSHKERQAPFAPEPQMQYVPGILDAVAGRRGIASDDPYQMGAKLEAWRQGATKEDWEKR